MVAAQQDAVSSPDGWVTLRVHFEDEDQALFVVLGFGPRVDVVDPESLRLRVETEVAATSARRSSS
jgi:predicted DNA-binding transcriptional regulator YafY